MSFGRDSHCAMLVFKARAEASARQHRQRERGRSALEHGKLRGECLFIGHLAGTCFQAWAIAHERSYAGVNAFGSNRVAELAQAADGQARGGRSPMLSETSPSAMTLSSILSAGQEQP
jgi:hypothetical protein